MTAIISSALSLKPPSVAEQFEDERIRLLVALCHELQGASGEQPFYLACRKAGELVGMDHMTAWRYLCLLRHEGILAAVTVGTKESQKATRWRYLPKLDT